MEKLIDPETEKQLKARFAGSLKGTVDLKIFTNPIIAPGDEQTPQINAFALALVRELSALDARIIMQETAMSDPAAKALGVTTSPSIAIGYDLGYRILYNGAPLGYEATGLIETIILASQRDSGLSRASREALKLVDRDVLLQVFVTPTCPYCPKSVLNANRIAIETRGLVKSECVETAENQALAQQMGVSSVPQQTVNGDKAQSTMGALPEDALVRQVIQFGVPDKFQAFEKSEREAREKRELLPEAPSESVYITDGNIGKALKKYPSLVIDCWAEWCMPCKMMAPVIESLAQENAGRVVFGKLNTDENQKTSSEYSIQSIPTMLVFRNGSLKGSIVGGQPKAELMMKIRELLDK